MSTVSPVPYIWYKFDTPSTSKVVNSGSAGASLDATLNNGASVMNTESPTGSTCLNITNTPTKLSSDPTGQYLSIPPFTFGESSSCSCWFKKADANELFARIFDFSLSQMKKLVAVGFSNTTGKLMTAVSGESGKVKSSILNDMNYCDNKWHHIAIVIEKGVTVYLDNVKIKYFEILPLENVQRVNNYIGRATSTQAYSTIQIDDFRLYTTPLTVSDIATLFTYKKPLLSTSLDQTTISILIAIVVIVIIIIAYMFS